MFDMMDELELDDISRDMITVFVSIYMRVDWKKVASRSIATDVFSHKLKVSGNARTVEKMIEKLSHSLGVQSIFVDPGVIMRLKKSESEVMRRIREETIYYTLLTMEANKMRRNGR